MTKKGYKQSTDHIQKSAKARRLDLIGQKFGRLVVLEYASENKQGRSLFLCKCICGIKKIISGAHLKDGSTQSCGCLQKERVSGSNKNRVWSIESRQKVSESLKGENNPIYGKKRSERTRQKISDNHADNSGPLNPNWKGGISCEPYCDVWADKEYKESILERDNHRCQNPDCWGTSERLSVHHIDYNKKNCRPENLITLCNSCNSRANKNRECWQKLYKDIMIKLGYRGEL